MRAVGFIMLIVALLIAGSQQRSLVPPAGGSNWANNLFKPKACNTGKDCGSIMYWCKSKVCTTKRANGRYCYDDVQCISGDCLATTATGRKGYCVPMYIRK